MALLVVVASYWGMLQYQDKQQREVESPQDLLRTLKAVSQHEASLHESMLEPERLRADLTERILMELMLDLNQSNHPDPQSGAESLLPNASRYLQTSDGLLAGLEKTLRDVSDDHWEPLIQQPEEWLVQVGEYCLLMAYGGAEPQHYWVWVGLTTCISVD